MSPFKELIKLMTELDRITNLSIELIETELEMQHVNDGLDLHDQHSNHGTDITRNDREKEL